MTDLNKNENTASAEKPRTYNKPGFSAYSLDKNMRIYYEEKEGYTLIQVFDPKFNKIIATNRARTPMDVARILKTYKKQYRIHESFIFKKENETPHDTDKRTSPIHESGE